MKSLGMLRIQFWDIMVLRKPAFHVVYEKAQFGRPSIGRLPRIKTRLEKAAARAGVTMRRREFEDVENIHATPPRKDVRPMLLTLYSTVLAVAIL